MTISELAKEHAERITRTMDAVTQQGMRFDYGPVHDLHSALYEAFKFGDRLNAKQADDFRRYITRADDAAKALLEGLKDPGRNSIQALRRLVAIPAGEAVEYLRTLLTDPKAKAPSKRRRKPATQPLTDKQLRAIELHAKYQGDVNKVAAEMGITRQTAKQHIGVALRKVPDAAPGIGIKHGRTKRLPTNRRGQVNL